MSKDRIVSALSIFRKIKRNCEDRTGRDDRYCYNMPNNTDRRFKDVDYASNTGRIVFSKCCMKYCPKLRDALKGINYG
jgi:hypothetical protein